MADENTLDYLQLMKKMVDVVAHDVRNPLNNILLSTAQFKLDTLPDKEDTAFYIDIIERNCDRINALLAEIAGIIHQQGLNPDTFDITELVKEVTDEFEDRFSLKKINCITRLNNVVIAHFDRDKMKAAMQQLLENALDALPGGGHIEVTVEERDGSVVLSVQDSGPGVAPAALPHIFAPFFTTRERHKGLGLALVKNVVEAHLGSIIVSPQGEPSRFTIVLPPAAI